MNDVKIYNVGVSDGDIKYNSYLIVSEKTVLIDTVKEEYFKTLTENINKITDIKNIDYLILNHTEFDRAGCVKKILELNPLIEVVSTISGIKNLKEQLNSYFKEIVAKSQMKLEIGGSEFLKFIITHNINWPDSMMTFYENEGVLFSCDGFSDEGDGIKEYYQKKLSHLDIYVKSALENLREIKINKILPGSGDEITDINNVISLYDELSSVKSNKKKAVVLVYDSVSGNTKKLADFTKDFYEKIDNIDFKCINTSKNPTDEILKLINESDGIIFASPTINRNISKNISGVINSLNHYSMTNKIFYAFGSYGWSGEAPNLIYSILRARHFKTFKSPFRYLFSPTDSEYIEFEESLSEFNKRLMRE